MPLDDEFASSENASHETCCFGDRVIMKKIKKSRWLTKTQLEKRRKRKENRRTALLIGGAILGYYWIATWVIRKYHMGVSLGWTAFFLLCVFAWLSLYPRLHNYLNPNSPKCQAPEPKYTLDPISGYKIVDGDVPDSVYLSFKDTVIGFSIYFLFAILINVFSFHFHFDWSSVKKYEPKSHRELIERGSRGSTTMAYVMCKDFVRARLKTPSVAEFGSFSESSVTIATAKEYVVSGFVDSQNSFGSFVRSNYVCAVSPNQNGSYRLLRLNISP